jgi:Response regulator receiver domain
MSLHARDAAQAIVQHELEAPQTVSIMQSLCDSIRRTVIALIPWFDLHVGKRRAIARYIRGAGMDAEAVVHIIDDDASLRDALGSLFRSVGLKICSYGSARDFIDAYAPDAPGCIVLVRLPGISGIDFQAQLADLLSEGCR